MVRVGIALGLFLMAASASAAETVSHVVARGHTLDAIANRYHVTKQSIIEANHITDPKHLKIGEVLTIPVKPKDDPKAKGKKPQTYAARSKTPGVIHATRFGSSENFTIRVHDRRSKVSPVAVKSFETMLRSNGNQKHPIDPRLIALTGIVSDHFGGRKIEVVSGYRPYTTAQFNPHSNHNLGKALDFRVQGVPNDVLRDYCKTLKNVGCGYYPNSFFIHMDVREKAVAWVDYSKPGEAPQYDSPSAQKMADEGGHNESPATEPSLSGSEAPAPAASGAAAPTAPASPNVPPAPTVPTQGGSSDTQSSAQ